MLMSALLLTLLMLRDTLCLGQTVLPYSYLQTVTLTVYTQTRMMERRARDNKN